MPNWCFSQVIITDTPEKIKQIKSELDKATSSNPIKTDFGNYWLGYLLMHIGMDKDSVVYGDISCRGVINYIDAADDHIEIETESAWQPHIKCIQKFVETYSDTAKIKYYADEPGCEVYWTNDPEYAGTVNMDVWLNDPEEYMFYVGLSDTKKEHALKALQEHLGEGTWEELCDKASRSATDDEYVSIHLYDYVDLDNPYMT